MSLLFLSQSEVIETTIVGGNVEADKYQFCIYNIQKTIIEPMLGTLLYDKIISDLEGDSLSGDYQVLFFEFIKPITKNFSVAEYIRISNYTLNNKGLMLPSSENNETANKSEREYLASKYDSLGQSFVLRFEKWISDKNITEYKSIQDEVNPTSINNSFNWFFK